MKYLRVTEKEWIAICESLYTLEGMMGGGDADLDNETGKALRAKNAVEKRYGKMYIPQHKHS